MRGHVTVSRSIGGIQHNRGIQGLRTASWGADLLFRELRRGRSVTGATKYRDEYRDGGPQEEMGMRGARGSPTWLRPPTYRPTAGDAGRGIFQQLGMGVSGTSRRVSPTTIPSLDLQAWRQSVSESRQAVVRGSTTRRGVAATSCCYSPRASGSARPLTRACDGRPA